MFPTVFKCFQRFLSVSNGFEVFSTVLKCFQRFLSVSNGFEVFSTVLKCFQRFLSVLNAFESTLGSENEDPIGSLQWNIPLQVDGYAESTNQMRQ